MLGANENKPWELCRPIGKHTWGIEWTIWKHPTVWRHQEHYLSIPLKGFLTFWWSPNPSIFFCWGKPNSLWNHGLRKQIQMMLAQGYWQYQQIPKVMLMLLSQQGKYSLLHGPFSHVELRNWHLQTIRLTKPSNLSKVLGVWRDPQA